MVSIHIESKAFNESMRRFWKMTGKELGSVVKEQSKLLSQRLAQMTPPKNQEQGKKAVRVDIGKVYLRSEWFINTFQFTNQKLGERVKRLVLEQNEQDLRDIFNNSRRMMKLYIEGFDPRKHQAARNNRGRVPKGFKPYSYPLTNQEAIKSLTQEKEKAVGICKSGWGYCAKLLGGRVPGWMARPLGSVEDGTGEKKPYVIITNNVSYFASLDGRQSIVERALAGRAKAMISSAEKAIERAKSKAGV